MRKITSTLVMFVLCFVFTTHLLAQSTAVSTSATQETTTNPEVTQSYNPAQVISISPFQNFIDKPISEKPYDQTQYEMPRQGGDDISSAVVIPSVPYSNTGTTTGYTNNYDEACPYSEVAAPDVVYVFTPGENMCIDIDLCGSAYDTKLYVYENTHTPGAPFACNDDYYFGPPCGTYVSALFNLSLTAGNTYYIVIDGYGANNGAYYIDITPCAPPCVVECPVGGIPESELCGESTNGGCDNLNLEPPLPATFELVNPGDIICGKLWASGGTRDTDWFELELTTAAQVILHADAQALMDFGLLDYGTGTPGNPICPVGAFLNVTQAGSCSSSTLDLGMLVAGTHWFWAGLTVFDGFPCDVDYWIEFEVIVPDCLPNCPPGATLEGEGIIQNEGADNVNGGCNSTPNIWGSIVPGETICGSANTYTVQGADYCDTDWYRFDGTSYGNGVWNFTFTAQAELPLLIFIIKTNGGLCENQNFYSATAAPCGTATVSVTGVANDIFDFWVGPDVFTGYPPEGGPYNYVATLTGTFTPLGVPPNDLCEDAIPINCVTGSINGTTILATFDAMPDCVTLNTAPGVWYLFTTDVTANVDMHLCSTTTLWDSKLSVYEGDCAGLICITGNDDFCDLLSGVSFLAQPGTNYYVLVHGFGTSTGAFQLDISCEPLTGCLVPINLTATNNTATSTDLGWTEIGTATMWNIEWGEAGFTLGTGTLITGVTNNPYTLSGLNAATEYEFYVQADCGEARLVSEWAGPFTFTTTQIPATLPFTEDFETWPSDWTVVNGTQVNQWHVGTAIANTGAQSAYISNDGGITNEYFIDATSTIHLFRDIVFTDGSLAFDLSFWWKGQGEGYAWDRMRIYLTETSIIPVAGFELTTGQIGLANYNLQPNWTQANIVLPGTLSGQTKRLVFSWSNDLSDGTQPPVAIDDVEIKEILFGGELTVDPGLLSETHDPAPDLTTQIVIVTNDGDGDLEFDIEIEYTDVEPANEWTVNVFGTGFGDEVTWELRDNTGTVILSGGPYEPDYNDSKTVLTYNEPLEFYIEAIGNFGDNTPSYTISCGGELVVSGSLVGNTEATHSGLICPDPIENEWTVNVFGTGFGDEVTWELRDNTGTVILSGGPYEPGYNDTQTVLTSNEPLEFYIEAMGTWNDNTPTYSVSCSGDVVASGTLEGGDGAIHSDLICPGPIANEWTVNVFDTSFGDEVTWELRDNMGTVILSGGPYGAGYNDIQTVLTSNEPLEFYIEAMGTWNDNTPSYTVSCGGSVIVSGSLLGGNEMTHSDLVCSAALNNSSRSGWLSVAPVSGFLEPGASASVVVTFSSIDLVDGEYFANIHFNSNNPFITQPEVTIPVGFTVVASICHAPTGLAATNITPTSALLGWTAGGTELQWNIEWGLDGFEQGVGGTLLPGVTNSYLLESLDPATDYEFYVQADCGTELRDLSEWAGPFTFKTLCDDLITIPWTETFENDSPTRGCWTQIHEAGTANWTFVTGALGGSIMTAYEGNLNARFVSEYAVNSPITKLVSPLMDLSATTAAKVTFYYGQEFWSPDQNELKVHYRISPSDPWVEIAHYTENISVWTEETLSLPNPSSTYQIAFEGINNFGRANVLDNVTVEEQAPEVPENLNITGVTNLHGCFDATNTITVTNSTVSNGSTASFKAGVNIMFGDGFVVEAGAYMHAEITEFYCNAPVLLSAIEETIEAVLPEITAPESFFKVFPNPTTGNFKLELLGADEAAINVEIYGMMGEKVFQDRLFGSMLYDFDLSNMPKGIYFIRVLKGNEMGIEKVIKH